MTIYDLGRRSGLRRPVRRPARLWLWLFASALLLVTVAAFPFIWKGWIDARYGPLVYSLDRAQSEMAPARVAIVFGARVYPSGRLSAMLRDRVDTAVELYRAGKVQKLLVSGDNRFDDYNEPGAMMDHAIAQGVPAEDIQPDFGGRRTYDTCYRAREIFQVEEAVLVTQGFHLPRALFLCEQLGLTVRGVSADRRAYDPRSIAWSESREVPALLAALFDALRRVPPPVMGEPIPIE